MNLLKKIKNNKASAENAMFVFGVLIFATIVVFCLSIFGATWQRYLTTREVNNIARLYAIRSYDLYYDGGTAINPQKSKLGEDMQEIMKKVATHTNIKEATFVITNVSGVELFKITSNYNGVTKLTATSFDIFKNIDYGDTLYAKLKVNYNLTAVERVASVREQESSYTITNKFAFEQKASNNSTLG